MSWVELDGVVSEEIVRDDDIRRRVAASGRSLRSHATGMSDDDLLAKLRGLGVDADREKLAFRLLNNQPGKRRAARPYTGWRRVWPVARASGTQGWLGLVRRCAVSGAWWRQMA
jgi:hypothetical protein